MMETWKNPWGSRLHNGEVGKFLRNKLSYWKTWAVTSESGESGEIQTWVASLLRL